MCLRTWALNMGIYQSAEEKREVKQYSVHISNERNVFN
jgi:hypothetical protein